MIRDYVAALRSEWLKRRRSLGSWLIVVGASFTPAIVTVARVVRHAGLPELYTADDFWTRLWSDSWESMAVFFLPMAAILATSLVTQIEYRNNAWKQVHTLPLGPATVFFAKLTVILVMMVQFFVLFDLGIYLSAVVPSLLVPGVPYPQAHLPAARFLADSARYFVDCLPIVAAQYLLSLRFRSFLVPIGFGFLAWVGALAAVSWRFGYLEPYAYSMLHYLVDKAARRVFVPAWDLRVLALGWFILFLAAGYGLFATRAQKG